MLQRSARALLTIVVVQAMGSVWMCYAKQSAASHYSKISPTLSRAHALPLALLCILRIILIFDFKSITVHIAHIILSLVSSIHTLLEVFHFQTMSYGLVNVTEVTLNGLMAVVMLVLLFSPGFLEENMKNDEEKRRARKIIIKHYMEGDLLTPDENDDLVKAYKKMK